jgi:general secretion pathway protein D
VKTFCLFLVLATLGPGLPAQTPPATNLTLPLPKRMNRAEGAPPAIPPGTVGSPSNPAPALPLPPLGAAPLGPGAARTNPAMPAAAATTNPLTSSTAATTNPVIPAGATLTNPASLGSLAALPTNLAARAQSNLMARMTNAPARTGPPSPGMRPATNAAAAAPPARRAVGGPPSPAAATPTPGAGAGAGAAESTLPKIATPSAAMMAAETNVNAQAEEKFPPGLIKLNDADPGQVLDVYQMLTGRTVLRAPNLPATKITVQTQSELTRKEAIQALDSILSLNGIAMTPQGDKFVKAVLSAQAGQEARPFNELKRKELPESGSLVAQVVRLTNALPRDVAPALVPFSKLPNSVLGIDSAGILILRDYAENVKRMMEVLEQIDVVPQQEFESIVIPIKYALASDISQVLGSLTAGGSSTTVGHQDTRTGLTSGGSGGLGGRGGTGTSGYGGMNNPMNPQGTPAGGLAGAGMAGGAAGRSSFADRLRQIVNKAATGGGDIVILNNVKIIADERTNSLLIFASKSDLATISNIIDKLDVVLPQVLIEAIILEVSLGDSLNYGVSYLQNKPATAGTFAGIGALNNGQFMKLDNFTGALSNGVASVPSGFSYAAKWGDFEATATAAASDSRINVLSRPRIQTSHAVEANLFIGRTRPYITGTYGGGYGGGYTQSQYQQMQIGITLSVLPLINPDGLVVMDIRQRIQSLGANIKIDGNDVPETIEREANAKVSVRDRETVMLGGFISDSRTRSKSGVPILKDIPILGALFSSNKKENDRQELIVLIRPTVLPNPADAAVTAMEEKRKLPGVRAAEREFGAEERKRLKQAAKDEKSNDGM